MVTTGHAVVHGLGPTGAPLVVDQLYRELRESVISAELIVLRAIDFELRVDHPHKYLLHLTDTIIERRPHRLRYAC